MIKIYPYKKAYQDEIDEMMNDIANEFKSSISSNDKIASQLLDGYWVASHKSEIAGTVGIIKMHNGDAILKNMFVRKAHRGEYNGVSNLLLEKVYQYCDGEGIGTIYLGTMGQFKAAHKFYEKNGFSGISKSELPLDFKLNPLDNIFYKKSLSLGHNQLIYRKGSLDDLHKVQQLAMAAWEQFQKNLAKDNWQKLYGLMANEHTFIELIKNSDAFICETRHSDIVGKAFLVPSGNPTEIYDEHWCYIRFVSVHPLYRGKGIGKKLTEFCIEKAKTNNEKTIALHTSIMMPAARHIYESLGFKIHQELEPRLGKRYWLYLLKLD